MSEDVSLRRKQRQVGYDAALDAVVDLIEQSELSDLSMPDVARAAGISLRTLYRYFPTRDDLLTQAAVQIQTRMGLPVAIAAAGDIPASFWAASGRAAEHPQLARALLHTAAGRSVRAGIRSERVAAVHAAVAELTVNVDPEHARQAAAVIAHLCSSSAWMSVSDESDLHADDARHGVMWALNTLLDALRTEADQQPPLTPTPTTPPIAPEPTTKEPT